MRIELHAFQKSIQREGAPIAQTHKEKFLRALRASACLGVEYFFILMPVLFLSACGAISDATPTLNPINECPPRVANPLALPAQFPTDFPLPATLVIWKTSTSLVEANHPRVQIVGYAPMSLDASAQWLYDALPKASYSLGIGDAEAGEIEAPFQSKAWQGNWWLTAVKNCPTATKWVVQVIKR